MLILVAGILLLCWFWMWEYKWIVSRTNRPFFFVGIGGFTGGNNEDSGHFQVLGND